MFFFEDYGVVEEDEDIVRRGTRQIRRSGFRKGRTIQFLHFRMKVMAVYDFYYPITIWGTFAFVDAAEDGEEEDVGRWNRQRRRE